MTTTDHANTTSGAAVAAPVDRHVMPPSCEGACEPHEGEHRRVHVTDRRTGHDWGLFWYCDEAIRIDKYRGLHVEEA